MSTSTSNPTSPPPPQEKDDKDIESSGETSATSASSSTSAPPTPPPPPPPTASGSSNTTSHVVGCNSTAISTDSLCLVQMWSNDDDSVYTRDGIVNTDPPQGKESNNKQTKRSPSLIANEPLDFGSIFRTIHAMRCSQPQPEDKDGGGGGGGDERDDDNVLQQGQQEDKSLAVDSSAPDSSFAYGDTDADTVTSTEKGYETRLSYTRSFIEQMMSDSCASVGSSSNLGAGGGNNSSSNNNLDLKNSSRSSPFPESSASTTILLGSSLALDLTTTDEDGDDDYRYDNSLCGDDSHVYEVQSSTNGGYDTLYDEESNANISMQTAKTPVTKNGYCSKTAKTKGTGASHVVDQLEDTVTVSKSIGGGGIGGVTSIFKVSKSSNNSSFSNDKQAWLYQHRKKVFLLLGLLVIVFGLVIAVMVLTSGDDSGTPSSEASSVNNNNNSSNNDGFPIPDDYKGGTLLDSTTTIPESAGTTPNTTTTLEDDTNSSTTTATTIINLMAQLNLTTFPTALLKTRASTNVNESPSLLLDTERGSLQTVFGPLDSAFDEALSAGVINNRMLHDKEWGLHLDKLLRHHMVLDSIFLTDQMQDQLAANEQQQQYLTMASGEKVALGTKAMAGVDILGLGKEGEVSFIMANLTADNGVLHVINGLLRPKFLSMTVMDILEQKQNLSTFASLLVLAGLDDELRNVDAEFTIFAPTNDAFEALHPMTMDLLQSSGGREVLTETLQRHLLPVVLPTTNDVVPVGTTTKLGSGGLLLKKDASGVMSIDGATFTARDTLALNGIVHTLGSVLLPTNAVATPAPTLPIPSLAPASMPTEVSCGNFECPQYMEAKPNKECQESIADCRCITGYERQQDGSCIMSTSVADDADAAAVEKLCSFQCPSNAKRRENRQCWSNIDDCYCMSGYQKNGNSCVQTKAEQFVNRCMYSCPPNSSKRPNRNCIESFDDCQCDPGHVAISIGCI